jgi:hypothetical protein
MIAGFSILLALSMPSNVKGLNVPDWIFYVFFLLIAVGIIYTSRRNRRK